jgi:hypothetical protein
MTANVLSNNQQQTLAPDIECNAADKMMKPSTNTGNGKQIRKDYKHQKRPNNRKPEWKKALCVKSVMKRIMKLTKEDLKSQLNDKKTSLDELSKHQQMDTRIIENMRLSLLAVEVYEHHNTN